MTNPYLDPHGPVLSDPAPYAGATSSRWQMPTAATDPAHRPGHPPGPAGPHGDHRDAAPQHHDPGPAPTHTDMTRDMTRPATVTIACLLQWLNSAILMAGGLWIIVWLLRQERPDPWTTIMPFVAEMILLLVAVYSAVLVIAGVLIAAFTVPALRGARWPRWVLAVLNGLTLLYLFTIAGPYVSSGEPLVRAGLSESGVVAATVALAALATLLMIAPIVLFFLRPANRWLAARAQQKDGLIG